MNGLALNAGTYRHIILRIVHAYVTHDIVHINIFQA